MVSAGHENPLELWLEAFNTAAKGGTNGIAAYSEESTPDNAFKVKSKTSSILKTIVLKDSKCHCPLKMHDSKYSLCTLNVEKCSGLKK